MFDIKVYLFLICIDFTAKYKIKEHILVIQQMARLASFGKDAISLAGTASEMATFPNEANNYTEPHF